MGGACLTFIANAAPPRTTPAPLIAVPASSEGLQFQPCHLITSKVLTGLIVVYTRSLPWRAIGSLPVCLLH